MTRAAVTLARLEESLLELIACLEAAELPGAPVLERSWERVEREFAGLGTVGEAERESVERCQRLHVLATGLASRRREELVVERQAVGMLRERLGAARQGEGAGGTCDVRA